MKNYAFIFARGGSKGLPGKNIKLLKGKPLIQYAIEIAQKSNLISKIFVSSDNKEILRMGEDLGAIAITRPPELATDTSPEWDSWMHAIKWVEERHGVFDNFISLPPTSPLRRLEDVDLAVRSRTEKHGDICIGISESKNNPYFNMVQIDNHNHLKLVNSSIGNIHRRQDQPEVFNITTVVYCASPIFIKNHKSIFDGKVVGIIIPKQYSIDIDDIFDFRFVEAIIDKIDNE